MLHRPPVLSGLRSYGSDSWPSLRVGHNWKSGLTFKNAKDGVQ